MKFYVYAQDQLIGWTDLSHGDPPMGVVFGSFHPTFNYGLIAPLIQERQKYDQLGKAYDTAQLERIDRKLAEFQLSVIAEDNGRLHPSAGIHISDFSAELEDDAFEISLLGLPEEEYVRYFRALYDGYLNQ